MSEIQYNNAVSGKLKEEIYHFMEENCFAVIRVDLETVVFYNGLKISKYRNSYSIKDTNEYHEIDNLFLLKLIFQHVKNAVKSQKATKTA
jgi:hypothetical protein